MFLEWLNDYKNLQKKISYYEFKIKQSKIELKRWQRGGLVNVPITKGSIAEGLINGDYIKRDEDELKKLIELRDELIKFIDSFDDLNSRILKLKYIDGLSLYEISERLSYSYSHIKKLHSNLVTAINAFDKHTLQYLEDLKSQFNE